MRPLLLLLLASTALAEPPEVSWYVRPQFVLCGGQLIALPLGMQKPVTCEEALVYGHLDLCAANLWLANKEVEQLAKEKQALAEKFCKAKYKTKKKQAKCLKEI